MDGLKAINEMNDLQQRLGESIKIMGKCGRSYAEAEKQYRMRAMQETLKERDKGTPATLIGVIVKGLVAEEKFQRDEAEALWKTAQENCNVLKLQIRVLESQINREYSGGREL